MNISYQTWITGKGIRLTPGRDYLIRRNGILTVVNLRSIYKPTIKGFHTRFEIKNLRTGRIAILKSDCYFC